MAHNEVIRQLLAEQKQRDAQWEQHVETMFSIVPNVTRALEIMLELPPEDIKWLEIEASDGILLVGVAIRFPVDGIPQFVEIFAPSSIDNVDPDVDVINQLIRVGIPLNLIHADVSEIIQFFYDMANGGDDATEDNDTTTIAQSTPDNLIFDSSELTPEQTQKLLMFQTHTSDVKH